MLWGSIEASPAVQINFFPADRPIPGALYVTTPLVPYHSYFWRLYLLTETLPLSFYVGNPPNPFFNASMVSSFHLYFLQNPEKSYMIFPPRTSCRFEKWFKLIPLFTKSQLSDTLPISLTSLCPFSQRRSHKALRSFFPPDHMFRPPHPRR